VDNAVKYSPKDSIIRLSGGLSDRGVYFLVENEGFGITEEQLTRIFEPGYRISSHVAGSGYGLTLARRMVQQQGGALTAALYGEGGCAFRIVLPTRKLFA